MPPRSALASASGDRAGRSRWPGGHHRRTDRPPRPRIPLACLFFALNCLIYRFTKAKDLRIESFGVAIFRRWRALLSPVGLHVTPSLDSFVGWRRKRRRWPRSRESEPGFCLILVHFLIWMNVNAKSATEKSGVSLSWLRCIDVFDCAGMTARQSGRSAINSSCKNSGLFGDVESNLWRVVIFSFQRRWRALLTPCNRAIVPTYST